MTDRVRYEVEGDRDLLQHWPDRADAALKTVDQELIEKIGGYDKLTHASRADVDEYWRLASTWKLQPVHDDGPWALYTYVGLTSQEEQAYAKNGTMAAIIRERVERIEPIVAAIAIQTEQFYDHDLPAQVNAAIVERGHVLTARAAIVRSLDLKEDSIQEGPVDKPDRALGGASTRRRLDAATPRRPIAANKLAGRRSSPRGASTVSANDSRTATQRRQPHWLIPAIVGVLLAIPIGWFGINDWRVPWARSATAPTGGTSPSETPSVSPSAKPPPSQSTAPVEVTELPQGGIDITWSIVNNPELHGYDIYVTAVRPVEYEYAVPRYAGDRDVTERIYPAKYLNKLLREVADPRRVKPGQLWHICVQGMKETPLNEPIDDYIIPGTRSCSDDFTLPH